MQQYIFTLMAVVGFIGAVIGIITFVYDHTDRQRFVSVLIVVFCIILILPLLINMAGTGSTSTIVTPASSQTVPERPTLSPTPSPESPSPTATSPAPTSPTPEAVGPNSLFIATQQYETAYNDTSYETAVQHYVKSYSNLDFWASTVDQTGQTVYYIDNDTTAKVVANITRYLNHAVNAAPAEHTKLKMLINTSLIDIFFALTSEEDRVTNWPSHSQEYNAKGFTKELEDITAKIRQINPEELAGQWTDPTAKIMDDFFQLEEQIHPELRQTV